MILKYTAFNDFMVSSHLNHHVCQMYITIPRPKKKQEWCDPYFNRSVHYDVQLNNKKNYSEGSISCFLNSKSENESDPRVISFCSKNEFLLPPPYLIRSCPFHFLWLHCKNYCIAKRKNQQFHIFIFSGYISKTTAQQNLKISSFI